MQKVTQQMNVSKKEADRILLENHIGTSSAFFKFMFFANLGIKTINGDNVSVSMFE